MVNPPRDEIRKIRAQLQEYGQVGDANVFYWFQNRKSRSKHKLRHLQNSSKQPQQITNHTPPPMITTSIAPSASSSSSSSEKSSPNENTLSLRSPSNNHLDLHHHHVVSNNSPTSSINLQANYFQTQPDQFTSEAPYFFPVHQQGGFLFSELSNVVHHDQTVLGPCTSLLLSEIMGTTTTTTTNGATKKDHEEYKTMKMHPQQLSYSVTSVDPSIYTTVPPPPPPPSVTTTVCLTVPSNTIDQIQAESGGVAGRPTVFINDVAFEVNAGPFNVKEAFGDDAMLIHSSGQPLLTNEWGVTLQSLQHGAFYYLVTFS